MTSTLATTQRGLVTNIGSESCRTVLIGDTAVGKSSIALRFVHNSFHEHQVPTIGAAFVTRTLRITDEKNVKFEIWDTAGQERFHSLVPMYYRKAKAAIVVYDITDQETFRGAKKWVKDLQRMGEADVVIALIGNKLDKEDERTVDSEEVEAFAENNGLLYMETSAKTNFNIDYLFSSLGTKVSMGRKASQQTNISLENNDGPSVSVKCFNCTL